MTRLSCRFHDLPPCNPLSSATFSINGTCTYAINATFFTHSLTGSFHLRAGSVLEDAHTFQRLELLSIAVAYHLCQGTYHNGRTRRMPVPLKPQRDLFPCAAKQRWYSQPRI